MIKRVLRAVLPSPVLRGLREIERILFGMERPFRGKSNVEVFDIIYSKGIWGRNSEGKPISGEGSHNPEIVEPYLAAVTDFLANQHSEVIVDLGCGDFNVGKNLVSYCSRYIACDVSGEIIDLNKREYSFGNVEFRKNDISRDELPPGDVAFVRQVLQHLSNESIGRFVENLNTSKPYRYLLLSEHVPAAEGFQPNLDKPAGANIRAVIGSGVELDKPPFNLHFKRSRIILEVNAPTAGIDAIIRTTLFEL